MILTFYSSVALPDIDVEIDILRWLSSEYGNLTVGFFLFTTSTISGVSVRKKTLGIFAEQFNNLQLQISEPVLALHLSTQKWLF